jgi:hypothetical protein
LAGGVNLYSYAGNNPVSFDDPFGLCPKDVGGDDKSASVDDCSQAVKDAWAKQHIHDTSKEGTDLAHVDPTLMDAVVRTSMELRFDFGVSAGKESGHSQEGRHSEGGAVDINRVGVAGRTGLVRFGAMSDHTAASVGNEIGAKIANRLPEGSLKMLFTPGMAARTDRSMSLAQYGNLIGLHRTHIHLTVYP